MHFTYNRTLLFATLFGIAFVTPSAEAAWPELISTSFFQADESKSLEQQEQTRLDELVIRGQSSPFYPAPTPVPVATQYPVTTVTTSPIAQNQVAQGTPAPVISGDPFVSGQFAPPPASFDPFAPQATYGINGPQPYRYGWKEQLEFAITPKVGTSNPDVGKFGWSEFNYIKEYVTPGANGGTWTVSPQFNARFLDGPVAVGLDNDMYRFGLGFKYGTPAGAYGSSWEFGFTPAFATDFQRGLTSDAWQFDAHLARFWRPSPTWMWVLGVLYWDRVDDIVLPYGGAVWTPSDYFEARLLFPNARLEWFLGTNYASTASWFYIKADYHVESYQVEFQPPTAPIVSGIQFSEWRIMGGFRWETGWVETYLEGGIVLGREAKSQVVGSFDPDDAFMMRVGIKY